MRGLTCKHKTRGSGRFLIKSGLLDQSTNTQRAAAASATAAAATAAAAAANINSQLCSD